MRKTKSPKSGDETSKKVMGRLFCNFWQSKNLHKNNSRMGKRLQNARQRAAF